MGETWLALGGLPEVIQTGQPHFSEHLKCLWSAGSLLGQALVPELPCADSLRQ